MEKICILLISFDGGLAGSLRAILARNGMDAICHTAPGAREGLDQAAILPPDLILIGPEDPCSVLHKFAGEPALHGIPLVALTFAHSSREEKQRVMSCGATAFLMLPLSPPETVTLLRALLRHGAVTSADRAKQDEKFAGRLRLLQMQMEELKRTDMALKKSYAELETTKLAALNLMEDLKAEVDQRKHSEEVLRESKQKFMDLSLLFRSISDNMVDMLWAKDLENRYIFTNKSFCDNLLIASDTGEPIGRNDMFFAERQRALHPDNPEWHTFGEICRDSDTIVLQSGEPEKFDEYGNIRGKFLFLDVRKSPLYDHTGKLIGTVGSAQDRTAERAISRQLAEREQQLSTLVTNLPGMVYRCHYGPAGRMFFVSHGCQAVTGYSAKEFLVSQGVLFDYLILEDYREMVSDLWKEKLKNRQMVEIEFPIRTASGEIHWVWERGRGVYGPEGEVLYLEGYIEDITARRSAQEEIKKLNDDLEHRVSQRTAQLQSANQELEAFSYSVSHDLRAPLRAIDGFARILTEDYGTYLDEEGKRICSVIQENAIRMGQLIDDLLALSRLNRADIHVTQVNMTALFREVYEEIATLKEKNCTVFRIGELIPVPGDQVLLRQVLVNLIGNALKFSSRRETAEITVGSTEKNGLAVYSVADNGAGFDMKYADKMFGAFQRLHSVRDFEGTGIGLAIVQRIIHRHGGKVWAVGAVNQGATFYFSLPLKSGKL